MTDRKMVQVPVDLLAQVLDTAEGDSFTTQAEWSCNDADDNAFEAARAKIRELRTIAGILEPETPVVGQGFFGVMNAMKEREEQ